MEDWQEWQIRADQIAHDLGAEIDTLEQAFFSEETTTNFRAFWPRFRDLKERVRTAPAIRLEAKLDLERGLRSLGSRAYKGQEVAFARSSERKVELIDKVTELRRIAELENDPRSLRNLRRDFERMREEFDSGTPLAPADRQAVWDIWREANQLAWQRLVDIWNDNERYLRDILETARDQLAKGNSANVRQQISRFFDSLKTHEAKQEAVITMKAEADSIRREADNAEQRASERTVSQRLSAPPAVESWRLEIARNRELAGRLSLDVAELERQYQASNSILDQAMVRGQLVDKKRKLNDLERSTRTLSQRVEQTEESPLIPSAR